MSLRPFVRHFRLPTSDLRLLLGALTILTGANQLSAGDKLLDHFPVEVACGLVESSPSSGTFPDLPFDPARGYGWIGGEAGAIAGVAMRGGEGGWPSAWREGIQKYAFRLPNGEYSVRLSFLETGTAAAGVRRFDVFAQGELLFGGVDLAGTDGDFTWVSREDLVLVRDGWLDLRFEAREGSAPPRLGRIRLVPASHPDAAARTPLAAPAMPRALPAPGRILLSWDTPVSLDALAIPAIAGYGVFRSETRDGPAESLTEHPVHVPWFAVEGSDALAPAFYRIRAYRARGGQSPLSPPVEATALPVPLAGPESVSLQIPEAELRRLLSAPASGDRARAFLEFAGSKHPVEAMVIPELWRRLKSWRILPRSSGKKHGTHQRELILLAEPDDPSALREKVCLEMERSAGLPAAEATHRHFFLNGRYQGIYLEREPLGEAFRRRFNLDRAGSLFRAPGRLLLEPGWPVHGTVPAQTGDLHEISQLVHELGRLEEAEIEGWFEKRFYLDRLIDRLALQTAMGIDPALPGAAPPREFLYDTRNGKWDLLTEEVGSRKSEVTDGPISTSDLRHPTSDISLFGFSLQGRASSWRMLETRFFARPALRTRYLDRLEQFLGKELLPERIAALAEKARDAVLALTVPSRTPLPAETPSWLLAEGRDPVGGAEGIVRFYRAHHGALLDAIRAERARPPEGLVLNEICLRPGARVVPSAAPGAAPGVEAPWIELLNRSREPIELGDRSLAFDLDRPGEFRLPAGLLKPGERLLIQFQGSGAGSATTPGSVSCPLTPPAEGGTVGLFRIDRIEPGARKSEAPRDAWALADLAVIGRSIPGESAARLPDGSERWATILEPTPGRTNGGNPLELPPYRYRPGLEVKKNGDRVVWIQWSERQEAIASAEVLFEGAAPGAWERIPLVRNREQVRHEFLLPAPLLERHPHYHFAARTREGLERFYPLPGAESPFRAAERPLLSINEVFPRPSRNSPVREYLELHNASDSPVSVDGMFLTDNRKQTVKFRLSVRDPIPAKGFLVVPADGRGEGAHANFHLGNAGEYLGLFHRYEDGNILIDQIVFPAVPVDRSYGREREGAKNFKLFKDPTPGGRNLPKIPPEVLKKAREKAAARGVEPPEEPPVEPPDPSLAPLPIPEEPEGQPGDEN